MKIHQLYHRSYYKNLSCYQFSQEFFLFKFIYRIFLNGKIQTADEYYSKKKKIGQSRY